jgi:hypothetical protein
MTIREIPQWEIPERSPSPRLRAVAARVQHFASSCSSTSQVPDPDACRGPTAATGPTQRVASLGPNRQSRPSDGPNRGSAATTR